MNPNTNNEFQTGNMSDLSLSCSSYSGIRIEWPHGEVFSQGYKSSDMMVHDDGYVTKGDDQDYSFTAAELKQLELIDSSVRSSSTKLHTDEYYPSEYSDLMALMNQDDLDDFTMFGNELNRILVSPFAAEALLDSGIMHFGHNMTEALEWFHRAESFNLWEYIELMQEKEVYTEDIDHYEETVIERNSPELQSMVNEYLQGFGEKCPDHWESPEEDHHRKRRLCRHFLKGFCKRGKGCDFHHDVSIFCPNKWKVFLGGLPAHIREDTLRRKLSEQGYNVINRPQVLRGFSPEVCLGSFEEARRLIESRKILIDGSIVDVRPYEACATDGMDKRFPDDMNRSVFLGGLRSGTTSKVIQDDLDKLDVKVVNHPLIKSGFTPKVTLGSVEQTNKLIRMKKVRINDRLVDVRPYVNSKSPFYQSMYIN